MADQLTSVRFDSETIDTLRLLAEIRDVSVAVVIREAVAAYIKEEESRPTFAADVERAKDELLRKHEALAERLLSRKSGR